MFLKIGEFLVKYRWVSALLFWGYTFAVILPWVWTNTTIIQQTFGLLTNLEYWLVVAPVLVFYLISVVLAILILVETRSRKNKWKVR